MNLSNPEPRDHPLSADVRVREALELSIDRNIINDVVFDGEFIVGNQAVPPSSPWYIDDYPVPERDVVRARALLDEAGYDRVAFELMVANNPQSVRVGEVIQALVGEAGFDVSIRATEFATALDQQDAGNYDTFQVGWSGRLDPDGNIHQYHTCTGSLNETGYCDETVDNLLNQARAASTFEERYELYRDAAMIYLPNRHIIYLYHQQLVLSAHRQARGLSGLPRTGTDPLSGRHPKLGAPPQSGVRRRPRPGSSSFSYRYRPRVYELKVYKMLQFIFRRFLTAIPTLLIVTVMVFTIQRMLPGDPALILAGEDRNPEVIAFIRDKYRLDDPIMVQYFAWLGQIVQGDLGQSIRTNQPVTELILEKLPVTAQLAVFSILVAIIVAIPAGIIAAVRKNSFVDHASTVFALSGLSIPNFWLGIILILVVSVRWDLLPAGGYVPFQESPVDNLRRMIMPAIVLGTGLAAVLMRQMRSSMLEVLKQDYVRTAQAKGLRRHLVVLRHAFRNALIPVITILGLQMGALLSGAVLTEQVFTIPGFGKLVVDAV
ncbi:MAG: ABC transporter permease subunit, partial [Trueperaceae bacterium]|nr:ABC transporter permease subunit [Trueperaceae bacterium]